VNDRRQILLRPDADAVAEAAAQRLLDRVADAPATPAICLTGGSTPQRLYELLARSPWRERVPWQRVHWFLGDERAVPAQDPLSNGAMARRSFLDACAPAAQVHMIPTAFPTIDQAARAYQDDLQAFHEGARGGASLFDLVLLGVGPDGHVASLFPDSPALGERERWVVGVEKANVPPFVPRISLTLPCLASTREVLFLATGSGKREILRRVFAGEDLPANRVHPDNGAEVWLLDTAAAPEDRR